MGAILKKSLKEKALAPRELYGPGRSAKLYRCHENSYFPSPPPAPPWLRKDKILQRTQNKSLALVGVAPARALFLHNLFIPVAI